jgi:hypothetical protein
MKITKKQLKQIIKEEILVLEMFDTGSAGELAGAMSNEEKKTACETAGGEWVEGVGCKGLEESSTDWDELDPDSTHLDGPQYRLNDLLVSAASDAVVRAITRAVPEALMGLGDKEWKKLKNEISRDIEVPLMDALLPTAEWMIRWEKEELGLDEKKDKKWIQKAVPKDDPDRGKFSAAAKRAGMSTCAYARKVVKDPKASKLQKDRAQFALNTGCKDK